VTRVPLTLARRRAGVPLAGLAADLMNYARLSAACRRLAHAIDRDAVDAVLVCHCRLAQTPPLLAQLRTPTVYICHEPLRRFVEPAIARAAGDTPSLGTRALGRVLTGRERAHIRRATRRIANSAYSRSRFLTLYGVDSVVAYPGVDPAVFAPGAGRRERVVLSVGGLQASKGHHFVVSAVGALPPNARPAVVVVADRVAGREACRVEAAAAAHRVTLSVRERVSDAELVEWYQRAAVVACAQIAEPFGLAALEAMATATPVVAVDEGGLRETVEDGVTGYVVPRDVARFASRLAAVLDDPSEAARLGQRGREAVQARWTWEGTADVVERELQAAAG
jgi:glycosyltransferase involved in cell wall biosynthesis